MAEGNNGFMLFGGQRRLLARLDDAQKAALLDALYACNDGEEVRLEDPLADMAFMVIADAVKDVAWDYLKTIARACRAKVNESDLSVKFGNGSQIRLYGAENPDSLRGLNLCDVVFDEVAQMPYSAWTEVVMPMILANRGRALFLGTPKGRNALWRVWENARTCPEEWAALMYRASETGLLSEADGRSSCIAAHRRRGQHLPHAGRDGDRARQRRGAHGGPLPGLPEGSRVPQGGEHPGGGRRHRHGPGHRPDERPRRPAAVPQRSAEQGVPHDQREGVAWRASRDGNRPAKRCWTT